MRTIQPADEGAPPTVRLGGKGALPRTRRALRLAITVLSVVLVWGVLVVPDRIFQLTPAAFARIPLEGLVLVAVAVAAAGLAATDRGRRRRNPVRPAYSR